jgi:hypothetical protein
VAARDGSTNWGRNDRKNTAIFGFRTLVSMPWTKGPCAIRGSDFAKDGSAGGTCDRLRVPHKVCSPSQTR